MTEPTDLVTEREQQVACGYALEPLGLRVLRELTSDEWAAALRACVAREQSATWGVGDLLVYGARRGDWGNYYTVAMEATGLAYQTLSHKAACSRAWPHASRVAGASWALHNAAVSLPEEARVAAVRGALGEGWTAMQLSAWVARQRPSETARPRRRVRGTRRQLRCPSCGHQWAPAKADWQPGRPARGRPRGEVVSSEASPVDPPTGKE